MKPEKYRKKPIEVEAMLLEPSTDNQAGLDPNSRSIAEASGWMIGTGFRDFKVHGKSPFGIAIKTLEGVMVASPGDYIIKGVQGEFYPCKPDIFAATYEEVRPPLILNAWNSRIIETAYDDGDGNVLDLIPNEDVPWFNGEYDGSVLMEGLEHNGRLYSIVHASGGGLVSVIVGEGLIENEAGVVFHSVAEAKAYVQGLIAK